MQKSTTYLRKLPAIKNNIVSNFDKVNPNLCKQFQTYCYTEGTEIKASHCYEAQK